MTATPAPDVTDRTNATDEEFAARIAAFDGEAAPESFDATVERVARAMFERPLGEGTRASWREVAEGIRQSFRADAAAAIAAMPTHPAEEAVRRALTLADELETDAQRQVDRYQSESDVLPAVVGRAWVNAVRQFRAALATQAADAEEIWR